MLRGARIKNSNAIKGLMAFAILYYCGGLHIRTWMTSVCAWRSGINHFAKSGYGSAGILCSIFYLSIWTVRSSGFHIWSMWCVFDWLWYRNVWVQPLPFGTHSRTILIALSQWIKAVLGLRLSWVLDVNVWLFVVCAFRKLGIPTSFYEVSSCGSETIDGGSALGNVVFHFLEGPVLWQAVPLYVPMQQSFRSTRWPF